MGSLYIMISIPSSLHEKSLWIEKNLGSIRLDRKLPTSMRANKSAGNFQFNPDDHALNPNESMVLSRSVSDDSVLDKCNETPERRKRALSAIYMSKNKDKLSMEKRLENCLIELKIPNAVWVLGRAGKYYQVSFCTPTGEQCDRIIQLLNEHEIGVELNSTVSILPCSLYYEGKEYTLNSNKTSPTKPIAPEAFLQSQKEQTPWEQFVNSVRARLMVAQVVAGVKNNAVFTFDFLILLIIASLTAAVGLVENSVVVLVASMLISPLMGPVMASTFGFVTKDWKLQNIGILNEMVGLLLCVVIGFIYGICVGYLSWESSDIKWPTPEMLNRTDERSLWLGGLIALLSGAAVAIAVLGNYSGSLTGVAISASLMPPAVNAGLLWSVAVITVVLDGPNSQRLTALNSENPVQELMILGALSLALTFINIICIFLMGILVLKIKEVTPQGCKQYNRLLWKETMQIVHDCKYNVHTNADRMEQGLPPNIFLRPPYSIRSNQHTWTTYGAMQELNRPSVHDLTSMCHNKTFHPGNCARGLFTDRFSSQVNIANLWNVMSTPQSSEDLNITLASPALRQVRRFTVTPSSRDTVN